MIAGRSTRATLVAGLALLAAVQAAPAAQAVGPRPLKQLRQAPCPREYRPGGLEAEYTRADIDDALGNDRYLVAVGRRVVLVPPIDWHQDPVPGGSQTFRNALASLNWTRVLFAAYLEGRAARQALALEKAAAIFGDWIASQQRAGQSTTEEAWGSKRAGDRLTLITYLARVGTCERDREGKRVLSRGQAGVLLDSAIDHARYIERHRSSNNHGLFDAYALAVAAENLPFMRQAKHWRKLGVRRFETVLRDGMVDEEGVWLDHSSTYHFAAASLTERLLELPNTGDRSLRRLLGRMERVAAWLVEKPNGTRLQWGDSTARRAPAEFAAAAKDLAGLNALRGSGLAFVREGESYLASMASYFNRIHKHSDELSFGLYDRGHQIVSDSGDYERDPGAWRDFMVSPQAHSTLMVDGLPMPRSDVAAYGSGIAAAGRTGDEWYAIRGGNPLVKAQGVTHHRWLLYKPGVVLVVVDRLRSGGPHSYTRYFHLGPEIHQAPRPGGGLVLLAGGFHGSLIDRSLVSSQLHMIRGRDSSWPPGVLFASDPGGLQGYTAPDFEQATPRWTAAFSTGTGDDADYVASFGLDGSNMQARLVGPPSSSQVHLELRAGPGIHGEHAGFIDIVRNRGDLEITERP